MFVPRGLKKANFDHIRHGGVKFHKTKTLAYFSKNYPGAPKSRSAKFQTNWILG